MANEGSVYSFAPAQAPQAHTGFQKLLITQFFAHYSDLILPLVIILLCSGMAWGKSRLLTAGAVQ